MHIIGSIDSDWFFLLTHKKIMRKQGHGIKKVIWPAFYWVYSYLLNAQDHSEMLAKDKTVAGIIFKSMLLKALKLKEKNKCTFTGR